MTTIADLLNDPLTDVDQPRDDGLSALQAAALYLQGHAPEDPLASPLGGDPGGFPPTLIFVGAEEYVAGDAISFERRLAAAGRSVRLQIVPNVPHAWPVTAPQLAETEAALATIGAFVDPEPRDEQVLIPVS